MHGESAKSNIKIENQVAIDTKIMQFKVPMFNADVVNAAEISQEILNTPTPKKLSKEVVKKELEAAKNYEDETSPWTRNKKAKEEQKTG